MQVNDHATAQYRAARTTDSTQHRHRSTVKACSQQPLRPPSRLIRAAYSAYSTAFGRPGTIGRLALATRCRLHLVGRLGFSLDEKGFRREARPRSSPSLGASFCARAPPGSVCHYTCTACALHVHCMCMCTACALHVHCTWTQARGPRLLAASRLCAPRDVGGLRGGGSAAWSNLRLPGSGSCRAGRLGLGAPSWRRWPVGLQRRARTAWARTAALESLRGAYQRCRPHRILSIRRRRSGRFFSRPMPRAHTGSHRSVAVIALPCPATLRIRGEHVFRLQPCV